MSDRTGQLVFVLAATAALELYTLTAPSGLPWNDSTRLAAAYLGESVRPSVLPHPVWGFYVQVFGGPVALSVVLVALAAGLVAAVFNRYFGWRVGAGAAVIWMFLPVVWDRAITGERGVCLAATAVGAVWALNAVMLRVTRKARAMRMTEDGSPAGEKESKRGKVNRITGWAVFGASVLFALGSLTLHDYRLGEAASVFARGVVDAAAGRTIVLDGLCDEQVVREVEKEGEGKERSVRRTSAPSICTLRALALRTDDAYRTNLVAWVRSAFPGETNLWVAAQVSPLAFVESATKKFPDRFYLMNGKTSTLAQWERRWESFRPFLDSRDPFVRVARRRFGYEGNAVANALLELKRGVEGEEGNLPSCASSSTAWRLYKLVYEEVDPGNFSALVNLSEMIRRGYAASGEERKKVQERLEKFFGDERNRSHVREIARVCGPVRADYGMLAKLEAEAKRRLAEKVAAGEKVEVSPEVLSLVEWNNEMVGLMDRGELQKAGRIAREILSNPKWRGFIPANAVMGSVAASEGDLVASERFFEVATDTTNHVATVVLNDYADTLLRLGKLGEAEKVARRAVGESDEKFWIARLTLSEILEKKAASLAFREEVQPLFDAAARPRKEAEAVKAEVKKLLKSAVENAPASLRERIRRAHRDFFL